VPSQNESVSQKRTRVRLVPRRIYDMNIGMKFGLIFLMLVLGFGALAYAYAAAQSLADESQQVSANYMQARQVADHLALAMQKTRQLEKNFMLYKDTEFLDKHADTLAVVRKDMELLESTETSEKASGLVADISVYLNQYESSFERLTQASIAAGLTPEQGLYGELRSAVQGVEFILKEHSNLELTVSMLMLRRYEKDFLSRRDARYLTLFDEEVERFLQLLESADLDAAVLDQIQQGMGSYQDAFFKVPEAFVEMEDWSAELDYALESLEEVMDSLAVEIKGLSEQSVQDAAASQERIFMGFIAILVAIGLFTFAGLFLLAQMIRKPLESAAEIAGAIADGKLDNVFPHASGDETGRLLLSLEQMQAGLRERIEAEHITAEENGRIRQALDNSGSPVLVANEDMEIIYINGAATQMFRSSEAEIRRDIVDFNAEQLDSLHLDRLCGDTDGQRQHIASLSSCETMALKLGDSHFTVKLTPLFDEDGGRTGTFAEWTDRTDQVRIEEQVEQLVEQAVQGDLTCRVQVDGIDGFMARLAGRINELVVVAEHVVEDTQQLFSGMVRGDLNGSIEGDYQGSFAQLKSDANNTVGKLREVLGSISHSVNTVRTAAREISLGNDNLSQRTEQQASNLEETSSSMEEMTSTVRQNADHAMQANKVASDARELAEQGGSVVEQAVSAMAEISNSSNKVADIIGVIDEIAFQTNLLALNASVEAARAGEQGRGFAVVASEVRNLAGRSATAAREIKQLIEDSADKVSQGSTLVNQSGETLTEIVKAVKQVNDFVGEISAASQEQSQGIDEVNRAVLQMDELTQQNAALVEESAAAAESMDAEARELSNLISFFSADAGTGVEATFEQPTVGQPVAEQAVPTPVRTQSPTLDEAPLAATGTDDTWAEF